MRKQTKNITIRLTPEEYEIFKNRVEISKMKQVDFIRKALLENYIVSTDGITKLLLEISRVGNNINQIAKACNVGKLPYINELNEQTEILKKIFSEIVSFTRAKKIEATVPKISKKKMEKTILNLLEVYSEKASDKYGDN